MAEPLTPASAGKDAGIAVPPEKIYLELRASIRETDTISFKLLGLVPLVSGTALIALVRGTDALPLPAAMVLSLFAASITFGLFRWELRNVQTCSWLIKYAQALETEGLARACVDLDPLFLRRPDPPRLFGKSVGKSEAEKIVYPCTIVAWLVMPFSSYAHALSRPWLCASYLAPALLVLLVTAVSLFADPHVRRA